MELSTKSNPKNHSEKNRTDAGMQITYQAFCMPVFFRVACTALLLLFFLRCDQGFSQDLALPRSALESDPQSYKTLLERVHRSLTAKPLAIDKAEELANLPASKRHNGLDRLVRETLESEAFAQAQAQAWMLDHFEINTQDPETLRNLKASGWDTDAYQKWLQQAIVDNTRFDLFVQNQLTGDRESSSLIPTHAWYLAGQWSNYEILANPTPIESNLIRQFKTATESIEKAETLDWLRLQTELKKENNQILRWWRLQNRWPQVPREDLIFSWPTTSEKPPSIRAFREWTLVLAGRFSKEQIESQKPLVLFVQSYDGQVAQSPQRSLIVELREGRPFVRLIHDARISTLEAMCHDPLPPDTSTQIAIVNDGLGRPDSIRIFIDGHPQKLRDSQVPSRCYKEILSPIANQWRFGPTPGENRGLEQVDFYRLALSGPECRGLADDVWSEVWNELDDAMKLEWADHYARRVDLQWRYQRESRGHYAANMAAIFESQSLLPVLGRPDQTILLTHPERFPNTLLGEKKMDAVQNGQVVHTQADAWKVTGSPESIDPMARTEVARSWRWMTQWSGIKNRSEWKSDRWMDEFAKDWDRRKMLCNLISELLIIED